MANLPQELGRLSNHVDQNVGTIVAFLLSLENSLVLAEFPFPQEDGNVAQELGRVSHHVDQNTVIRVAALLSLQNGLLPLY